MKLKKVLASFVLFIIIFSNIPSGYVKALTENEKIKLTKDHVCTSLLKVKGEDKMKEVIYVYYKDNDGKKYPAFCVEPSKEGVGSGAGDEYDVTVNQISNNVLWRMLYKGYMGTKYTTWNLECDDDLYYATKTAIHCIEYNQSPKDRYEEAVRVGRGENVSLDDVKRRSKKVLDVAQKIYEFGYSGTENYIKPQLTLNKDGNLIEEKIGNTEYIIQNYKLVANKELSEYEVSIEGFINGTKVLNSNNIETTKMNSTKFKIAIPKNKIIGNVSGKINISGAQVRTYPIFYADSNNPATQNYVTYNIPNEKGSTLGNLEIDGYQSKLIINKVDEETKKPIPNVVFNAKYKDGTNIGDFTTNDKGEIVLTKLKQGTVILKEIKSNTEYILDNNEIEINIGYKEEKSKEITNKHKKGNIKIIKVDKDNNDLTLGGVEFDLLNNQGEVIKHIITDVNGEATINNINTGTYILRETKTKREYKLAVDQDIIVEWNSTLELKIENEKKKGQIKILKFDKDNNEIKLSGVEFQIINKNGTIVETIISDENGEALSSRLPIGEYRIKEVSLGTNSEYIMNDQEQTIIVEEDKIHNIKFENEHKKGNLKIIKYDKDNNEIPIQGVEFEVTDEENNKYNLITDENGQAELKNIRTGLISVKEIATNEIYELSKDTYFAEIKWNETYEMRIENEKIKGQIEISKIDEEDKEWKIEGAIFEVLDDKKNVLETIITDKQGIAKTSRLPIGEYYLKEVKTDEMHILSDENTKVLIDKESVYKVEITNKRIKGKIKIIKTSKEENKITGDKKGSPISGVEFEVINNMGETVDNIITNEEGIAISKALDKGIYKIREIKSGEWYLLNTEEYEAEIKQNEQIIELKIENEPEKPNIEIIKTGINQVNVNEEFRYQFDIKNTGNTTLSNCIWYDYLPYEFIDVRKIETGIYSNDINYDIYCKTNKRGYIKIADQINSKENLDIHIANIGLKEDEYITELKFDFGEVDKDFGSLVSPNIICKVRDENTADNQEFTNKTKIIADRKGYSVESEDEFTTIVNNKKIEVKKLPRTGF